MNIKNRLIRFMQGRYGVDELYKFLFIVYILSFVLNLILKSIIIEYLGVILVFIIFYRVLSKNIYQRTKENKKYLEIKNTIIKIFDKRNNNIKNKDNIYKKCPKCKTILKLPLPNEKGIKHVKCPKCKKRLTMLVLKTQKIEIIKNKK